MGVLLAKKFIGFIIEDEVSSTLKSFQSRELLAWLLRGFPDSYQEDS